MKFTEAKLEQAIITLLGEQGYPHMRGDTLTRTPQEVLLPDDLRAYLKTVTRMKALPLVKLNKSSAIWKHCPPPTSTTATKL